MGGLIGTIVVGVVIALIAGEIKDWSPSLARWLVRLAVATLPMDKRERYAEEWTSHLHEVPGPLSRVIVALGFCAASISMETAYVRREIASRALDITIATAALVALAPLLVIVALVIAVEGGGPILYVHRRVGRHGKTIGVLKFRTMRVNADKILHRYLLAHSCERVRWCRYHTLNHDPRVTPVGRFLRASSIDELPQLFNVLLGQMGGRT